MGSAAVPGACLRWAMRLDETESWARLAAADHGVLATRHSERGVDVVPIVFAVDGDLLGALTAGLVSKYPAYAGRPFASVLVLRSVAVVGWSAGRAH